MKQVLRNFRPASEAGHQYITELKTYPEGHLELSVLLVPDVMHAANPHGGGTQPEDYCRIGVLPDGTVFANVRQVASQNPEKPEEKPTKREHHYMEVADPELAAQVREMFETASKEAKLSEHSAQAIRAFIVEKLDALKAAGVKEMPTHGVNQGFTDGRMNDSNRVSCYTSPQTGSGLGHY